MSTDMLTCAPSTAAATAAARVGGHARLGCLLAHATCTCTPGSSVCGVGRGMQVFVALVVGSVYTISAAGRATLAHAHRLAFLSVWRPHWSATHSSSSSRSITIGHIQRSRDNNRQAHAVQAFPASQAVCVFRPGGFIQPVRPAAICSRAEPSAEGGISHVKLLLSRACEACCLRSQS